MTAASGPDRSGYLDYLVANREFLSGVVHDAVSSLPAPPGKRVMDMGTGAGGALVPLAALAQGGPPVAAVDVDRRAVEIATAYVTRNGLSGAVDVWQGDAIVAAEVAQRARQPFDLIWAGDVVWPATFEDPAAVVARLGAALRRGGVLALHTSNYYQSMFLPGHSRLERLARAASELTWRLPAGGASHYERQGAWMRAAGLVDVELRVLSRASTLRGDPPALAYLERIVWPEMLHAVRASGVLAGMSKSDICEAEDVLSPTGRHYVGRDPDTYVVQPSLLWTGRRAS